jgi:fructose-1,6-bisphosphatase/inositol monophosphatase family enzyme
MIDQGLKLLWLNTNVAPKKTVPIRGQSGYFDSLPPDHLQDIVADCQGIRRNGSAALDLCFVACGRLDGFWELKLKPWDIAAGALIVAEAGGMLTEFSGAPFSIWDNETLASNGIIHDRLVHVANTAARKASYLPLRSLSSAVRDYTVPPPNAI